MTTLAVGPDRPAPPGSAESVTHTVTVRCDVCVIPYVITNTPEQLREIGWLLREDGEPLDVCHVCRRRKSPQELVHRAKAEQMPPMSEQRAMPNFLIIGAGKAATTSMHAYLDLHPGIHMSPVKEAGWFADPDGEEWREFYESMFDPRADVRGESSTLYSQLPHVPGVVERVLREIPDARFLYMVRDPIDRAVSWWTEMRMHSNDHRPFAEAFRDLDDPFNTYVATSRYATQLKAWLEHFPIERFAFVEMEELGEEPAETLGRMCRFLGVDDEFDFAAAEGRLNVGTDKREYSGFALRLRNSRLLRLAYKFPPETRERMLAPVKRILSRPMDRPEVDERTRGRLRELLAPEADEFRRLTGRDFARWSV